MATQIHQKLEPWSHLEGEIVMVTGASSGLDLAKAGCRVVAAARRMDRLKSLCDQINKMDAPTSTANNGRSCRAIVVELDIAADGPAIAEKAWGAFGHIDA